MVKIVIDPGHGGSDSGAVSGGNQEKNFTLNIALKVRDHLQERYSGADVLMTRTTDKTVSLRERTDFANRRGADYFCSIHINAGGGTGWESYIYNGRVSQETFDAQDTIHRTVINVLSSKYSVRNRGEKRANFHVLRETAMPAILMENLFIDTSKDLNLLKSDAFINDLAQAIGDGIGKHFSLKQKDNGSMLYRVIAGSFNKKKNAQKRSVALEDGGFDTYIWKVEVSGKTVYRVQAGAFRDRSNAEDRLEEVRETGIKDAYILQS